MAHETDDRQGKKRELTFENGRPVPVEDDEEDEPDDSEADDADDT